MEDYDNNLLLNDKAINTLELFTQSAILYQLDHYPQQFLTLNPSYNLTALTASYVSKIDDDIQTILEEDIENQIYAYSE
jgi:16S rRNA G527 N7-methylase RsmG